MNTSTLTAKVGSHPNCSRRLHLNLALLVVSIAAMLAGAAVASVSGSITDAKMLAASFLASILLVALPIQMLVALRCKRAISSRQVFLWAITLFIPSGVLLI